MFWLVALSASLILASSTAAASTSSAYVLVDKTWLVPGATVEGVWRATDLKVGAHIALFVQGASTPAWHEVVCDTRHHGKCPTTGKFSTAYGSGKWTSPLHLTGRRVWEVRLFSGPSASTVEAISQPLVYASPPVISATQTSLVAHVFVQGTYERHVRKGDWVGLFPLAAASNIKSNSLWYHYLPTGSAYGSFSTAFSRDAPAWKTPAVAPAGPWEFRYVTASGALVARSRPMQFLPNVVCRPHNKPRSKIEHVIVFSTENHSFDSFFGDYCKAPAGSKLSCNYGRNCCEAAPAANGPYIELNDTINIAFDPNHSQVCELCEIDGGKMDKYRTGCPGCSTDYNLEVAPYTGTSNDSLSHYFNWAKHGAIADRFFQNSAGASSQNDVYLAYGRYLFTDNNKVPNSPEDVGGNCYDPGQPYYFQDAKQNYDQYPTVGDLLELCGISWGVFPEGYAVAAANVSGNPCWPFGYDASDVGQSYAGSVQDKPSVYADSDALLARMKLHDLPAVSYVRSLGIHSEHPGSDLTSSQLYIQKFIDTVRGTGYWDNTVVIVIPDESGGYFDHVSPPPTNPVDQKPYGPRTPFVAIGGPVKTNYISHVQMEMSSIIRLIEWNWLANGVGQLGARDTNVNGMGDIFVSSAKAASA